VWEIRRISGDVISARPGVCIGVTEKSVLRALGIETIHESQTFLQGIAPARLELNLPAPALVPPTTVWIFQRIRPDQ
jgi:hypothetical protein